MIQSLQPIASPYKNELPHDTELLFGAAKSEMTVGFFRME